MNNSLLSIVKDSGKIIAFIGGGGKTTVIYNLAQALSKQNKKVIITTTTHMKKPRNMNIYNNEDEILFELRHENVVFVANDCVQKYNESGKVQGVDEELINKISKYADYVLVEADGAKGMPLKSPREHEPAIPDTADMVVAVVGLDCVGKPLNSVSFCIEEVVNVLNKERYNNTLKSNEIDEMHRVEEEDIVTIIKSTNGYRKNVDKKLFKVVLNKADTTERVKSAKKIVERLNNQDKIICVITSFSEDNRAEYERA